MFINNPFSIFFDTDIILSFSDFVKRAGETFVKRKIFEKIQKILKKLLQNIKTCDRMKIGAILFLIFEKDEASIL